MESTLHDLEEKIRKYSGDRDKGIEIFQMRHKTHIAQQTTCLFMLADRLSGNKQVLGGKIRITGQVDPEPP